jgi:hypothetical protein
MKIAGFLVVFLSFISAEINGQSLKQDSIFLPDQLRQYQFQLEEPVEKIEISVTKNQVSRLKGLCRRMGSGW